MLSASSMREVTYFSRCKHLVKDIAEPLGFVIYLIFVNMNATTFYCIGICLIWGVFYAGDVSCLQLDDSWKLLRSGTSQLSCFVCSVFL